MFDTVQVGAAGSSRFIHTDKKYYTVLAETRRSYLCALMDNSAEVLINKWYIDVAFIGENIAEAKELMSHVTYPYLVDVELGEFDEEEGHAIARVTGPYAELARMFREEPYFVEVFALLNDMRRVGSTENE